MYIAASTCIYLAIKQCYRYVHAPHKFLCLLDLHRAPDWCHYSLASHQTCNAILGDDIVILLCRDRCVASCSCLCLFLHCIKKKPRCCPRWTIFSYLRIIPFESRSSVCVYFLGRSGAARCFFVFSQFILSGRPRCRQAEWLAADEWWRRGVWNQTQNVFIVRLGKHCFWHDEREKESVNRYGRTFFLSPPQEKECTYNPRRLF